MPEKMPLPSRKRALELGAAFIEEDLDKMRQQARRHFEEQEKRHGVDWDGAEIPLTTSLEGDLMKAVEWAWAAATLRCLAAQEK